MYFKAEEMDYWYGIHGEGIPVVLLHGFTGSTFTWDELTTNPPEGIQLISVDLPGHGQTKGTALKTMDNCIRDLHALFKMLNLKHFFLLGYSMGGRTALSYVVKYPENIKGLLLESASPGLEDDKVREERRINDEKLASQIEEGGVTAFVNYWEDIPLFDTQKELPIEAQQAIRSERLAQSPQGLANSLRGMGTGSQSSNWEALANIRMPVLLLAGELDKKFIMINKKMQKRLSHVDLKIIPDVGHAIHIEKPEIFQEIVVEFAKYHSS